MLKILSRKVLIREGSNRSNEFADMITKGSHVSNSSSSVSVNNDWKHYVVFLGNEEVIREDVCSFENSLGLKFRVLSRNKKVNNDKAVDRREGPM